MGGGGGGGGLRDGGRGGGLMVNGDSGKGNGLPVLQRVSEALLRFPTQVETRSLMNHTSATQDWV